MTEDSELLVASDLTGTLAERRTTAEEYQKETVASLLLHPGHTASRNILAVLMAPDQAETLVVLRFPCSSLSINRDEYNNSV
ncbi:hypothetical protein KDI_09310 [Dictyobacter arantiisoli]|uniref:Uncharacterized protein n=1 Tax=Dictyobacter arantiisoli TaxID=2014874 RepID=A0A5A5T7I2_9CHLR|nr:hypothetical protein KDI_09310 [Dictyobacter arantiisoli]